MASGTTLNARNLVALGPERLAQLLLQVSEGKSSVRRLLQRQRRQQFRKRRSLKAHCSTSGSFMLPSPSTALGGRPCLQRLNIRGLESAQIAVDGGGSEPADVLPPGVRSSGTWPFANSL